MKKILYLVTEDWYFWSHRLGLAEAAMHQGYEIHVVTRAGEFAEEISSKGFILHPLSMDRSIGTPFREIDTLFKLIKYYRCIKPDLVHHIALKPVLIGSIVAWFVRVPAVINSYTGLGYLFISNSFLSGLFRFMVIPFFSLLLNSKRYYSIMQNCDDEKLLCDMGLVVPERMSLIRGSGVDTQVFSYSAETDTDCPVVLFASRFLKDKGIMEFIEAVRQLKSNGINARFVVVGERDTGNPTSINEQEFSGWINEGIIESWGYHDDMEVVFSEVNLVCLPSYREGLPKVLLEAASCGRAIVTTDVPGCREVVQDGVNGILVPAYDPSRLAAAIQKLIDSPELRKQMGLAGREQVIKYFDIQRVNKETLNLYNVLVHDNN